MDDDSPAGGAGGPADDGNRPTWARSAAVAAALVAIGLAVCAWVKVPELYPLTELPAPEL